MLRFCGSFWLNFLTPIWGRSYYCSWMHHRKMKGLKNKELSMIIKFVKWWSSHLNPGNWILPSACLTIVPHCLHQTDPCGQTEPHRVDFLHFEMRNREVQALIMATPGPELWPQGSQLLGTFPWLPLKRASVGACMPCLGLQVLFTQRGVGSAWLLVCCLHNKCHLGRTSLHPQPRNQQRRKEYSFAGFRHLDLSFQFLSKKMQITESGGRLRSETA